MYWPEVQIVHIAYMESHSNPKLAKIHTDSAIKYFNKWGWFDKEAKSINRNVNRGRSPFTPSRRGQGSVGATSRGGERPPIEKLSRRFCG